MGIKVFPVSLTGDHHWTWCTQARTEADPAPVSALPPQLVAGQAHSSRHLPCGTWNQPHRDPEMDPAMLPGIALPAMG